MTNQSVANAHARARRALDELDRLGLEPSPTNIALWTAHLSGEHPELSATLEALSAGAGRLTETRLQALYVEHLVTASQEALDLSGVMSEQLHRATELLAQADNDASRYGAALEGATTALRSPLPESALQSLVTNLVQATDQMRERTRVLETKLAETSGEVKALRDNLTRVREEALTDPLTGLANRKRFDETLEEALRNTRRTSEPLCLVLCDIDHFKRFNDTWGHNTGDQIIRFVAGVLQATASTGQLVARHGGEEFAIVAEGTSLQEAAELAEHARASIESKILRRRTTNESLGKVTASFGVAQYQPEEARWQFFERADTALYESKTAGRNRVSRANAFKAAS